MTRKKSNVKALALAVTCAILAGGYSGLNPVYAAADTLYKDGANVTTSNTPSAGGGSNTAIEQLTVGGVTIGGTGGDAGQIIAKNIVGITNIGETTPSAISINGATFADGGAITAKGLTTDSVNIGGLTISSLASGSTTSATNYIAGIKDSSGTVTAIDISGTKFESNGAITATSLKLNGMAEDVKTAIEAKAAKTDVEANKNNIDTLKQTVGDNTKGLVKDVADNKDSIAANTTAIAKKADQTALDTANGKITALETKTTDISYDSITGTTTVGGVDGVTFKAGAVSGVSGINDDIIQFTQNGAENIVQINSDLRLNDNTGRKTATLSVEGLAALNSMVYGADNKINKDTDDKTIIQVGNGSVVGGVTFDNKKITNVDSITVNEGKENQVQITSEGIVVGLTSAAINGDGFYAGGHNYNDAKAALDGKDGKIKGAGGKFGVDEYGNVTTTANIKGKDITAEGNLTVDGDAEVKKDLKVTGNIVGQDITAKGALKGQTLGIGGTGTEFTVDTVGNVTAHGITTSDTTTNKIGGVTLAGSDINAKNLTLTGTLIAAKYNATDIEATNSIKVGATTMTNGKLDLGSNGTVDFGANELNDGQVGNINNVIKSGGVVKAADGSVIGGVSFSAKDITGVKDLTATGKVTAVTISDGTASLSGGALTGLASVKIGGNTDIDSTGIKTNKLSVGSGSNATTIDDANGVVSAKGVIGAVKFSGSGKLDDVTAIDGVSVAQNSGSPAGGLTFGNNAIIGATGIPFQSTGFKVDDDGDVEGKTFTTAADGTGNRSTLASGSLTIDSKNTWTKDAGIIASNVKVGSNELKNDGLYVGTNTTVKDGVLTVGAGNTWSMTNGITASKAEIHGVTIGETEGKAVFNKAGKATTIDGDKITTGTITADELNVDKISLGKGTDKNITIGSNGDVTTKGDIKITDAAGNVMSKLSQDQATFGNAADNQTTINKGKLNAKAKNTANQQAEFNFDENGLTVSGLNAAGATSSFGFNAANGIGTFTDKDGTTTAIKGSEITSTNGTATGVLNGSNLTLTNGANSTALTAGGATFTGAAGDSSLHGTETKINGGIITTDTLNVERINLGENILDSNGTPLGSNLSMDKDGNFTAAGGNFKVTGGTTGSKGSIKNVVGDATNGKTAFETNQQGANMSFEKGGIKSEVAVADDSAQISAGASSIEVKNEGITNNGKTTFNGTTGTTTIDGGTITTNHLITDKLTITGSGNADGTGSTSGSIAFGGNGSITSNIKDGTKEATFKTDETGTFTKAEDGANVTTNTVNAQGNTNKVTDGTNTSTATQTATSIGGVVTNGTVKIAQTLDGANGNITNEVTDKDGKKSTLVQNGTGLTYTDSANTGNATRINSSDVSIGSATDDSDRINLSDLGQIDDLDGELTARSEYTGNPTAVGAINAEAAIRREEVARLDNRIDDVNNRVDKVGAMAAAIASLKSIGYDPQAPSEFSIGLGQYKGETGVAMGFFHYPNKNFMINVSLSTAGGETMGGIGATWRFGHKSPQKLLDEQREAQARKELAAAEKYQAAAKLAKEAQERAEYAAKLARQAQVSADNAKAAADATQAKHFQ